MSEQPPAPPLERRKTETWIDLRDVFALVGLGLMAAGLWFIYWPASMLVPGALLFWLAVKK